MEAREHEEYGEDFARYVMPALGDLCRMPLAPVTPRDVAMQALHRFNESRERIGRPMLESVESLQAKVLSVARSEALADIQDAIGQMSEMANAINQLIALHGLPLRSLFLPQPGMLAHAIETLLAESRVAKAKLERGGLPLRAEQPTALNSVRGRAA
ncbi:hypothetical protein K5M33_10095 [Chromobacterium vaccinii]|nr:hypothetical protein [Chromobacterium vaccinii]MBX9357071.1 hypothetical protein [Chromobacterium vaccinii]